MWLMNLVLVPLIVGPAVLLVRKRLYRDAVLFGAVSLAGYVLWYCIAAGRPVTLSAVIARVIDGMMALFTG